MTKIHEKIILYPREYNKRGESNLHSVMGVTHDGELVNIKLRLNEEYQDAKTAPSIHEFSRTDRKAKSPAIASPNNSSNEPEGIILFTGAIYEKTDKVRDIKHYIASWAHILREDSDAALPHLGIGRIKVKKESSTVKMIRNKLKKVASDTDRQELIERMGNPKNYEYSAIFYSPEQQIHINKENILKEKIKAHDSLFYKYFSTGISFGYYAVICDKDMNPIPNMSKELLSQYSPITGEIDSPEEFKEKICHAFEDKLQAHGGLILIPCYKLNPTNNAKNYYSMKDRLKMIYEVFHTPEGHARANTIASRMVNLPGGRGVLFDKAHPLEYEKFNLDLLDFSLRETRVYSSKMTLDYNNTKIDSIRIGIVSHDTFLELHQNPIDDKRTPYEADNDKEADDPAYKADKYKSNTEEEVVNQMISEDDLESCSVEQISKNETSIDNIETFIMSKPDASEESSSTIGENESTIHQKESQKEDEATIEKPLSQKTENKYPDTTKICDDQANDDAKITPTKHLGLASFMKRRNNN